MNFYIQTYTTYIYIYLYCIIFILKNIEFAGTLHYGIIQ